MRKRATVAVAVAIAGALVVSACSSSATSGAGGSPTNRTAKSGSKIKLGVLTSETGVASSSFNTVALGVKARIGLQNAAGGVGGHKLSYVTADDTSTGPGAVAGSQKLIQQDHVYGMMEISSFFAAAATTTTRAGIPVAGVSFDGGPEWFDKTKTNLFDAYGYGNFADVSTTFPKFFKSKGVTRVYTIGYADSPSAALYAKAVAVGSKHEGLQATYDNSLAFGSTNVAPLVQKIKAYGADAIFVSAVNSTEFAVANALRQANVKYKVLVLSTGYGQDVISDPATRAAATGAVFPSPLSPIGANTAGTRRFAAAMKKYSGVSGIPTFAEYLGWLTTDLMIDGLKKAGPTASSRKFISELRSSTWNSAGLASPTDFAHIKPTMGGEDQNACINFTEFDGKSFVPEKGASPMCGTVIKGLTIKFP